MCISDKPQISRFIPEPLITTIKVFCIVVIFSIDFAYIEAAVVVYLRQIFHSDDVIHLLYLHNLGAGMVRGNNLELSRQT